MYNYAKKCKISNFDLMELIQRITQNQVKVSFHNFTPIEATKMYLVSMESGKGDTII